MRAGIAAVSVAVVLAACGSNGPKTSTSKTVFRSTTTTTSKPKKAATSKASRAWVEGVHGHDADALAKALTLTAHGSPAAVYTQAQMDESIAQRQSGQAMPPTPPVLATDGGFKWCYDTATTGGKELCYEVTDFRFDARGRLVDVTINGRPLGGRVVAGTAPVAMPGGTVRLSAGMVSSSGDGVVLLTLEFVAGAQGLRVPFGGTFVGADGAAVEADLSNSITPTSPLPAGSKRMTAFVFNGVTLPGRITFPSVCLPDNYEGCVDVVVPTGAIVNGPPTRS